jgi:hypothetical protein
VARIARAAWLTSKPADQRSEAETGELFDWWRSSFDGPSLALKTQLAAVEQEQATLKGRGTTAHVMNEKTETPGAFILFRGEYDKRKDLVQPKTPDALPPMPAELPRNRLGFAQWLMRPEHPLTARVTVHA